MYSVDIFETPEENCTFAANATLSVSDFSAMPYSGDKQMINLTSLNGTLNNVPVNVKITKDGADIGTYSGLSGDGLVVSLGDGIYNAVFSVENA